MFYFWITLLIILNAFWLVLVPFALPGNWLIVITTSLFAWWRWQDGVFSPYTLIAIAILALIGELVEFFAAAGGAKKAGATLLASVAAIIGAIAGALIGTLVLPLLGTIIGACIGAGLAASIVELAAGKTPDASIRSGLGASLGHLLGSTAKLAIGVAIWLTVTIAALWP
jgi:uncharacterized protein YqgC (DUF456 family)